MTQERQDKLKSMSYEQLVGVYRMARTRIDEEKKEFEAKQRPTKELMRDIETQLLDRLNEGQMTSIRTDKGTAYISTLTSVSAPDWDLFINWVRATGRYEMLERRPAKSEIMAYVEDDAAGGELPPGVAITTIRKVNVRAS